MKIITFNIKHIIIDDILWFWRKRYKKVVDFFNSEKPDIVGVQELTRKSKKFLKSKLKDYYIVGESRHSKFPTNEYNCLIIKNKYKLISCNTYSLSDNIYLLGTKSEKDNYPRICVIAHIKDKKHKYMIVNTHIDNSDFQNKKRLLSICEKIIEDNLLPDEYIILLGDYNMTIDNNNLKEFSKKYTDPFKYYEEGTFPDLPNLKALDHIFLDKRLDFYDDKIYKELNDRGFISDHNPIGCEIKIKNKKSR